MNKIQLQKRLNIMYKIELKLFKLQLRKLLHNQLFKNMLMKERLTMFKIQLLEEYQ